MKKEKNPWLPSSLLPKKVTGGTVTCRLIFNGRVSSKKKQEKKKKKKN